MNQIGGVFKRILREMKNELGEAIHFNFNIPDEAKELIIDAVIVCANASLPPGTKFQIRAMTRSFDDLENYGIAWYTNDDIQKSTDSNFRMKFCDADEPEEIGCVLIALLTTGDK